MGPQRIKDIKSLRKFNDASFPRTVLHNVAFIFVISNWQDVSNVLGHINLQYLKELRSRMLDLLKGSGPNIRGKNNKLPHRKGDIISNILTLGPYLIEAKDDSDECSKENDTQAGAAAPPVGGVVPGQGVRARAQGNPPADVTVPDLTDGRVKDNAECPKAHVGDTTPVLPPAAPAAAVEAPATLVSDEGHATSDGNPVVREIEMRLAIARLAGDVAVDMTALRVLIYKLRDENRRLQLLVTDSQSCKNCKNREDNAAQPHGDAGGGAGAKALDKSTALSPIAKINAWPIIEHTPERVSLHDPEHVAQNATPSATRSALGLVTPPDTPEPVSGDTAGVGTALPTNPASVRPTQPEPVKIPDTAAAAGANIPPAGEATPPNVPNATGAEGHGLLAAPKMTAIFIGNVHPDSRDTDIQKVIQNAGVDQKLIQVYETPILSKSKKAFKAIIPEDKLDAVMSFVKSIEDLRVEKWASPPTRLARQGVRQRGNTFPGPHPNSRPYPNRHQQQPNRREDTSHGPHPYRRGPPPIPRSGWGPNFHPFWGPPMWNQQRPNFFY